MNVRTDPFVVGRELIYQLELRREEIGLFKAVRVRRDRRVGAKSDAIEGDGRPHLDHLDGIDDHVHRINPDQASAVTDVRVTDMVQENAFTLVIEAGVGIVQFGTEQDAAPVARRRRGGWGVRVTADGFIQPRGEVNAFLGRPQHLQRSAAAVDAGRRTADADPRPTQLEHGPSVDHRGYALRNGHRGSVGQLGRSARRTKANLVSKIVAQRRPIPVESAIAHNPHDVARDRGGERRGDGVKRFLQRPAEIGPRHFVHKDRLPCQFDSDGAAAQQRHPLVFQRDGSPVLRRRDGQARTVDGVVQLVRHVDGGGRHQAGRKGDPRRRRIEQTAVAVKLESPHIAEGVFDRDQLAVYIRVPVSRDAQYAIQWPRLEPEVEDPAWRAVGVAVQTRARPVFRNSIPVANRVVVVHLRTEIQPQFVCPLRGAAETGVFDHGIEIRIASGRHA